MAESDEIAEVRVAQWWKMLCVSVATVKIIRISLVTNGVVIEQE